jgi:hypothetical protein
LSYFKDLDADSTSDPIQVIGKKLKRALITLLTKEESFSLLYNLLVLNRLCYCYGAVIAHLNLTVNMDYSSTDKLVDLIDEQTIYNICNTFNTRMTLVLSQHIQNLNTGDKESQTTIMPYFEAYIRLFSAEFNRDLYNIGLTSQSVDGVITVDQRAMNTYNQTFEVLTRQNAEMYDQISTREVGFAKYEATHSMVAPINASTPSMPSEVSNMERYMDCWAANMKEGTKYGDKLWKQYALINKLLNQVPYGSAGTVGQYLSKVSGTSDDATVETTTFQASVCSSQVLLNGEILQDEEPDAVMEEYIANEKTLTDFKRSITSDEVFNQMDEALCEFNLAVPTFNQSLQTNLTYHPCNRTPKGVLKSAEIITQKPDLDETIRKEFTKEACLNNMRVLAEYKSIAGYATSLDRAIFNKRESGVARLNFLTNDIEVNPGAVKTITNSDYHVLVSKRRFTVALADSLEEPDNADEIPGFRNDFPTLIKTEVQQEQERKTTITRRRIFRIQNNGRAIRSLIGWMSTELSEETYASLKALNERSETPQSSRYTIEKTLASLEGYNLIDLIQLKWTMRNKIPNMKLDKFSQIVPEIYTMSYVEYTKIMDMLGMPDEKSLSSFRDMIFAAIRLDIITHVKRLRLGSAMGKKISMDLLEDIHDFEYTTDGGNFIAMVTQMLDALAKINIDPNVDSINKLYEARQMERITISMAARYKAKTGFEMVTAIKPQTAEQVIGEHDPDLENPEEDADADDDGQPDDAEEIEGDNAEDEFDAEELAGMVEGDVEVEGN